MKHTCFYFLALAFVVVSCNQAREPYHVVAVSNPAFFPDTAFASFEDLTNPKFEALKARYQLDTVFHGETDEFKRILLLRHWIHSIIKIDDYGPYFGDGSVESILDEALKGHGFHCGYFSSVQNAVMNGYGYVARCLLADVGVPVDYIAGGGHHAINEVWINKYHKWFLSDAKYDYHFEKDGIPLSGLEIRDEYLKNKGADIVLVMGPERVKTEMYPDPKISKAQVARIYTWLSWGKFNNRYSNYPHTKTDYMLFYDDDYFKNHVWLWDGKRHWAYDTEYMILEDDRRAIEWTPNVLTSEIAIDGNAAVIRLNSITPNLKHYQMKEGDGNWKEVSSPLKVELKGDSSEFVFRAVNLADVTGPEYRVLIGR